MNTLELRNVSFQYDDQKRILNHFSFKLKEGKNLCILGCCASGKSTLVNILKSSLKYEGDFLLNGVIIDEVNDYLIPRFIKFVDKYNVINNKMVVDLLFDEVSKKLDDDKKVTSVVDDIVDTYGLFNILEYHFDDLTLEYKYYLLMIINLMNNNTFLVIDNVMCYLRNSFRNVIFNEAKKRNVTLILFSSSLDEAINFDYLIFLHNGEIAMEGSVKECLSEEHLLKRLGYHLPFLVDLSTQLKDYGVIKHICNSENELEGMIWN